MKVSIIVPVLNEAENIDRLVKQLCKNSNGYLSELLVVDGGSKDDTIKIAKASGAKVLCSPQRGRAKQMNFASQFATGDLLYFVHGDTLPPASYMEDIITAVEEGFPIGCFRFRFESDHPLLRINSYMTRFHFMWCRGGDQTLFVTRQLFDELGGYCEEDVIMEDFYFIKKAMARYPFKIIPKDVLVSSRKYDANGYFKVQIANLIAFNMFRFGISSQRIAQTYQKLLHNR